MADHRFALDEDVSHRVARLLRARGWSTDSAKELGRLGLTDVQVLLHATAAGQILITHNARDFLTLHEAWVTWRRRWATEVEQIAGYSVDLSQHAGILTIPHLPDHDLVRILVEFGNAAGSMDDRLFAWSPTGGWDEFRV